MVNQLAGRVKADCTAQKSNGRGDVIVLRKTVLVMLCVALVFSLAACNVKQKINEKIAEKVTEGVLEKIAGDGTDIDISEGGITIKGEGGEKITIGAANGRRWGGQPTARV